MTELPLTVTRRRVNNSYINNAQNSDTVQSPSNFDKGHKSSSPFSSFSNLGTSLWNSAQHTLAGSPSALSLSGDCNQAAFYVPNTFLAESLEVMPSRDRTAEFRTTAKSCQMKMHGAGIVSREPRNHLVQHSVHFAQLAKRIGRDLSQTCAKMEKLTELAKRRSLFDDRMVEVDELSQMIKQDITGLNKQIAMLQEFSKKSGEYNKKNQGQNHSQLVVVGLQSKLAGVSKDFQNVLEQRTENLKRQKTRRDIYGQSQPVPSSLPPSVSTGKLGSILLQDEMTASSSVALDMDSLEQQRLQQQVSLGEQDTYLQARSSTMENIESSIAELGQIFRQLASLVAEQGEMITRIDSNVEETSLNVEAAHMELVKYFHTISQNRWLMIKIFGVLMIFVIIFIIFLT